MIKDVGIGLGIATVVLALFAGGKYLFFGDRPGTRPAEARATGTIAVAVTDPEPGVVRVNGKEVGIVDHREAFALEGLEPGNYRVVVQRASAPACERMVHLRAGKVEVVTCTTVAEAPPNGRFVLDGVTDDITIFVDGQEISRAAAREPLLLVPGAAHEILIRSEDGPDRRFEVILADNQEVRHHVSEGEVVRPRRRRRQAEETRSPEGGEQVRVKRAIDRLAQPPGEAIVGAIGVVEEDAGGAHGAMRDASARPRSKNGDKKAIAGKAREAQAAAPAAAPGAAQAPAADQEEPHAPASDDAIGNQASTGFLLAWTNPFARVFVDGRDTGKTTPIAPRDRLELAPGKHQVTFVAGGQRFTYPVVVEPGKVSRLRKDLPIPPPAAAPGAELPAGSAPP